MAFNAVEMIVPILREGFPEKGQKFNEGIEKGS